MMMVIMARRFTAPIFLGLFTVLALALLLQDDGIDNKDVLQKTLQIDAVYHSDRQYIEISYLDTSEQTDAVVLEVLGLDTTFQKRFSGSAFVQTVPFSSEPQFGWAVHPIVLEIDHQTFGHIQLKTEVHAPDTEKPPIIYSKG